MEPSPPEACPKVVSLDPSPSTCAGARLSLRRNTTSATAELAHGDVLHLVDENTAPARGPSLERRGNSCAYRVEMRYDPAPVPTAEEGPSRRAKSARLCKPTG